MVANYPNAEVFYPSDPVGIDAAIVAIQQSFASNIPWLEKVFGRATVQINQINDSSGRKRDLVYPELYQANDEPMNGMPNDFFKSYCFFTVEDPGRMINYDPFDTEQIVTRNMSIIFWGNLKKINPDQTGRFNENLIIDVVSTLKKSPKFSVESVFERYDKAFADFTISDEYKQFMKLPYTAFRIYGSISYSIVPDCSPVPTPPEPTIPSNATYIGGLPILINDDYLLI